MLNPAGSKFDFGNVIYAVLETCEHRRLSYDDAELEQRLRADAREKLDEIYRSYVEMSGTGSYWARLEREVLETVMPQYVREAARQNALERNDFGIWRGGDILARIGFGMGGLLLASFLRFIPGIRLVWLPSELLFAAVGVFLPEIMRWRARRRHSTRLNELIVEGERFQSDRRIHYLSEADLEDIFGERSLAEAKSETAAQVAAKSSQAVSNG